MDSVQTVYRWLRTCPQLQGLLAEYTDGTVGSCGLFSKGEQEISRQYDVTGGVTLKLRCDLELRYVAPRLQGQPDNAQWVMAVTRWIREQSLAGHAPRLGDDPRQERIRVGPGKMQTVRQGGTALYSLSIQAEFVKKKE